MRSFSCLFAVSLILLFSVPTLPQQTSLTTQRDPQALAILEHAWSVMGGPQWAVVTSTRETVQLTAPDNGVPRTKTITIITRGQNDLRMETQGVAAAVVMTSSSVQTEVIGREPIRYPRLSLGNAGITHIPGLSVVARWSDPKTIVKYWGVEKAGVSPVYRVSIQLPLNPDVGLGDYDLPCHIFIDAQTLLVARLDYPVRAPGNLRIAQTKTATYSDYRPVLGLLLPFQVTYSMGQHVLSTYSITDVSFNVPTTDSTFVLGAAQ